MIELGGRSHWEWYPHETGNTNENVSA